MTSNDKNLEYLRAYNRGKKAWKIQRQRPENVLLAEAIHKRVSQIEWNMRRLAKIDIEEFVGCLDSLSELTATLQALRSEDQD